MTANDEVARERLEAHERLCADRWQEMRRAMSAVYRLLWCAAGGVMTALGAIIILLLQGHS